MRDMETLAMGTLRKWLAVLGGSLLLGIGINGFLTPFSLLDGGMIGIALLIKYTLHLKAGLAMILLSTPIYLIAWFRYRTYFYNSLQGMLVSALFIDLLAPLKGAISVSPLWSAVAGGILVGTGIGVMLRHETSTGGTDLLAQFIADTIGMNVGIVIFFIDALVILAGSLILGMYALLYSAVVITAVGLATSICTWDKSGYAG